MQPGKQLRENLGGNFCGHLPHSPDFEILKPLKAVGNGSHPRILVKLMDRVTQYYTSPRLRIPSLDQANGSTRQQRSERREACLRLLGAVIRNMDLASLRIGQPSADGFVNYGLRYLALEARLGIKRAERAYYDLINAGLLSTAEKQPIVFDINGQPRGLNKPKLVSPLLFSIFGLGQWLKHEQKKKVNQLKKEADKLTEQGRPTTLTSMTRFKLFLGAVGNKLSGTKTGKKDPLRKAQRAAESDGEYQRQFNILLYEIMTANPGLSGQKVKHMAKTQLDRIRSA